MLLSKWPKVSLSLFTILKWASFIISTVSAYFGYHTKGGAIAVGRASTNAVVTSSILILLFNYILTDIILSW